MNIKNEYKAAFIAIVSLILFIWGFNYLKGKDILKKYNTFFAVTDNVEGLVKSTPVTLKGIQIGTLEDLKFYNGIDKTLIVLNINDEFVFSKDSKIKIYGGNIMGGKSVAIVPGNSPEMAKDGDTLTIMKMPGMFDLVNDKLTPLQDKFERILTSTDTLLLSINHILNPTTQNNIKNTLADLEITIRHFKNTTAQFDALMKNNQSHLNKSFENVDKLTSDFAVLSDSLKQIKIGEIVQNLNTTIAKLNAGLDKLNKGDGTMAKLMNDKKLYENLERSTKELELLLKDLRENPKRYVHFSIWGRKEKK
jgi:phospholipid/cholesterol/gamma-HCH transport system substrate-binding protein